MLLAVPIVLVVFFIGHWTDSVANRHTMPPSGSGELVSIWLWRTAVR